RDVQQKIVDYVVEGGGVLVYGEAPLFDMEGEPCAILIDALGLKPTETRRSEAFYYLSLTAAGWAAPRPETPTPFAQGFAPARGEILLRVTGTGEACGFDITMGRGRAIVISASLTADVSFFKAALERLVPFA
ncbi:MAG: glycosyl hydrolase, partial [Candidatus Dormibacteraeota bacterium]|nr:glycosyl hydrolase [Candidatus Dormibacteraeota bacterium]